MFIISDFDDLGDSPCFWDIRISKQALFDVFCLSFSGGDSQARTKEEQDQDQRGRLRRGHEPWFPPCSPW